MRLNSRIKHIVIIGDKEIKTEKFVKKFESSAEILGF